MEKTNKGHWFFSKIIPLMLALVLVLAILHLLGETRESLLPLWILFLIILGPFIAYLTWECAGKKIVHDLIRLVRKHKKPEEDER